MKRIAMFVPGGVADEASGIHIPSLVQIITRLSDKFSITVYPIISPSTEQHDYRCGNALVRNLHLNQTDRFLRQLWTLRKTFMEDHQRTPYNLLHGCWALPTGFAAAALGNFLRLPSIVSILGAETANIPEIRYGNMRKPLTKQLTLWTCRQANVLTALTRFQLNQLRSYGFARSDAHVIPHTVDMKYFTRNEKHSLPRPLHCLHVADINEVKDQTTLLKAFEIVAKNDDAHLRIVGRDQMNGHIHSQAHKLGLNGKVEFLGFQTQRQLLEHYTWADVLIHTSLHEGGGVIFAEAIASNVLLCGTNVGLLSDFADLGKECGITAERGEYAALAREITELVKDSDRCQRMRKNAYSWLEEHDIDWAVAQYSALYDSLLSENR